MEYSRFNVIINKNGEKIICNTFTGAAFRISDTVLESVRNKNILSLEQSDMEEFVKGGIIVPYGKDKDNLLIMDYLHNKQKFSSKTLSVTLLLTMNCNLRCVYCYEGAGIISKEYLDKYKYEKVLNFIKKQVISRESKAISICLFGGEPLLRLKKAKKFLYEVKKFCMERDIKYVTSIITNGTLVDSESIEILKDNNCTYEQITVDGTKDFHDKRRITPNGKGSYIRTINGIKTLLESSLPNPVIRVNVDRNNVENIKILLQELKNENIVNCSIDFAIVKGNTPSCENYGSNCFSEEEMGEILEDLWEYAEEIEFKIYKSPSRRNMYCGLYGDSAFTITPDCKVYKCWDLINDQKHVVGEIDEQGDFVNPRQAYFNWMTRSPLSIKECVECAYLPACGGGCAGMDSKDDNTYRNIGCYKIKGVYEKQVIARFYGKEKES